MTTKRVFAVTHIEHTDPGLSTYIPDVYATAEAAHEAAHNYCLNSGGDWISADIPSTDIVGDVTTALRCGLDLVIVRSYPFHE